MMQNSNSLTKEGLEHVKQELERLKSQRQKAMEKVRTARAYGDLSENSEYSEARDSQAMLESRINELENLILNAKIIKTSHTGVVELGSKVLLENTETKDKKEITIVASFEADPDTGKISQESPLGQIVMGRTKGDKVLLKTPRKEIQYLVKKVE